MASNFRLKLRAVRICWHAHVPLTVPSPWLANRRNDPVFNSNIDERLVPSDTLYIANDEIHFLLIRMLDQELLLQAHR